MASMVYTANHPTRVWIFTGVVMLSLIPVGVRAFRALISASGDNAKRRGGIALMSSAAASGTGPDLANLRVNYVSTGIDETQLPSSPDKLMSKWVEEACNCKEVIEPNAMCLATVGEGGKPSARFVLMKGYDARGVTWYTNYNSRKSKELKEFPHAAITFWWGAMHRSVRFEGPVARVSEQESDEYYACRPRRSKIGAWVSDQSELVGSREELDKKAKDIEDAFASEGDNVPRPPHWGGFRLRPTYVEFWEGQPSRLHDRIVYSLTSGNASESGDGGEKEWKITRLQP